MSLIRPFPGLRPVAGRAADVVAPPYDVLNTAEARQRAEGRPFSFLHISKPEIDLPEETDAHAPEVYEKGAENLRHMMAEGVLTVDPEDRYYVYSLTMDGHTQTGLVAVASVADYDSNRIRKHEFTRPDKEDDRVRQVDALNAQTGPVFLTFRHSDTIDGLMSRAMAGAPEVDVTADDGVIHRLWPVADEGLRDAMTSAFDALDNLYIADGHHRSAAASRVAAMRREANPGHTGAEPYNYFLSVIFPDDQMKILDYNRVVKDLNGLSAEEFLERVAQPFEVTPADTAVRPAAPATFGMYLEGRWYHLALRPEHIPQDDPVGRLDVSLLAANLIEPVLGITDPRRDRRIDFVGGIRGLGALEQRVDDGDMKVAFSLHPTGLDDLMAVADAQRVMPPKSTWFEPKLADGLVSHLLS